MRKIALWKTCLLFILCLILVLSTNAPAFGKASPNTGECALEVRVEKTADNNGEIQVFIRLTKNSGLDTLEFNLNYDASAFTLTKVDNLGLLEGADFNASQNYKSNPYYLAWIIMDENNPTSNAVGDIVALTFSVKNAEEKNTYRFSLEEVKGERFPEPDPVTGQVGMPQKVECVTVKDAVYSSDPLVLSMEGTATSWNEKNDAVYLLYDSKVSDEEINADIKSGNPADYLYRGTAEASTENSDGKRYDQEFNFSGVKSGEYKLAIFKPGKYVPKIVAVTVSGDEVKKLGELKMWLYGDVNYDGKVLANDAQEIQRYAAFYTNTIFAETETLAERRLAADVNCDGKILANDAQEIQRYAAFYNDTVFQNFV